MAEEKRAQAQEAELRASLVVGVRRKSEGGDGEAGGGVDASGGGGGGGVGDGGVKGA